MNPNFLNRKVSTEIGIIVILLAAVFAGWVMLNQYKKLMEIKSNVIEVRMFKNKEIE